eukprot:TRINITY_DN67429_c7_g2_i1.p1 TRINITY_DN67429_c7_g2~~TRINITY_DN67429_c7_g2_i1.p1  ORF type:complete len:748 (+),score=78.78 TRINITY_DN67429_c7_g2_i1:177-2246(+)
MSVVKWLLQESNSTANERDDEGMSAAMWAAIHGHLELLKYLVHEAHCSTTTRAVDGGGLIHCAATSAHGHVVEWLLKEKFATMHQTDGEASTALLIAARNDSLEFLRWCLQHTDAKIEGRDGEGDTALLIACGNGQSKMARVLVEEFGADVNVENDDGQTTVLRTAYNGDAETVKWLVEEKGCKVTGKTSDGWTAFSSAVASGNLDLIKWIMEKTLKEQEGETEKGLLLQTGPEDLPLLIVATGSKEAKLDVVKWLIERAAANQVQKAMTSGLAPEIEYDALDAAASRGHLKICKYLIEELKFSVKYTDAQEATVVNHAAISGSIELMKYLVEDKGADLDVQDDPNSPVCIAVNNARKELLVWLVKEKGCSPSKADETGLTPLLLAASNGHLEILKWLLTEGGAQPNETDVHNNTALMLACEEGKLELVKYLLESHSKDFSLQWQNKFSYTPFHLACHSANFRLVKYLVEQQNANCLQTTGDGELAWQIPLGDDTLENARVAEYVLGEGWWIARQRGQVDPFARGFLLNSKPLAKEDDISEGDWALPDEHYERLVHMVAQFGKVRRRLLAQGWIASDNPHCWTVKKHSSFPPVFQLFAQVAMWSLVVKPNQVKLQTTNQPIPAATAPLQGEKKRARDVCNTEVEPASKRRKYNTEKTPLLSELVAAVAGFWANDAFSPRLLFICRQHKK